MTTLQDAVAMIESARREEGLQLLRQIASSGDPNALFVLANLVWSGTFVPQDPVRGRQLFEYAASAGHGQANLYVTNLLANGVAGTRDWPLAVERLEAEGRKLDSRRRALDVIRAMDVDAQGNPKTVPPPRVLSEEPYVRLLESLLSEAECAYLIDVAVGLFEPSMVYDPSGKLVKDTIRTSEGAAFHWLIEDPVIHALNRRIAAVTATGFDQGEALQVLRYTPGQEYRPHFDYLEGADNPRPWTALVYLNEGYQGGATAFVCTELKVQGKTGDVLVFRNNGADGLRDPLAQHAGLPVTAGVKLLATRWIRERRWIP